MLACHNVYSHFVYTDNFFTFLIFLQGLLACFKGPSTFSTFPSSNSNIGSARGGQASVSIPQTLSIAAACPPSPTASIRENGGIAPTCILPCVDVPDDGAQATGGGAMTESLGVEIQCPLTTFSSNPTTLTTRNCVHDQVRTLDHTV